MRERNDASGAKRFQPFPDGYTKPLRTSGYVCYGLLVVAAAVAVVVIILLLLFLLLLVVSLFF